MLKKTRVGEVYFGSGVVRSEITRFLTSPSVYELSFSEWLPCEKNKLRPCCNWRLLGQAYLDLPKVLRCMPVRQYTLRVFKKYLPEGN